MLVEMNLATISMSGMILLIAASIRGFSGFGLALVSVPLLSMIMPPMSFVPLIFGMQIIAVFFGLKRTLQDVQWNQIVPLVPGGFIGTWVGLLLLYRINPEFLGIIIAVAVVLVAASLLKGLRFSRHFSKPETAIIGMLAGILNGAASLPGPPVILAQLVMPNTNKMVRSNLIIFFTILSLLGLTSIVVGGKLNETHVYLIATSAPFLILGTWLGERLFYNPVMFPYYRRISTYLLLTIGVMKFIEVVLKIISPGN
ncbi:MAG: sulfite exporter TauE/SafE family protein [Desulfobacterales bacterium]|nr:sulfite exporter TauE/SafE family protein [Desulfobacterales bacterium]